MNGLRLAFFYSIGTKRLGDGRLFELRHVDAHPFREDHVIFKDDDGKHKFTARRDHLERLFLCEIDDLYDWGGELPKTMVEATKQ